MRNRSRKRTGQSTKAPGPHNQDVAEARKYREHFQTMEFVGDDLKIDKDELRKKIKFLGIPIPKKSSDISNLPDKCFADMSFLFTVLAETPTDNGACDDIEESLLIRRVLRKNGKHSGAVSYEETFVTDLKIDGTKVLNAVIDPSFPHTVMNSNFFYTKFGGSDGNQGLFSKPAADDKPNKFVNGYKSRGARTFQFDWDTGRINSLCSIIQDSPFPVILGRAIHHHFSSQRILEQEFDDQKFSKARSATAFDDTSHMTQLGLFKVFLQTTTNLKSPSIDHNLEVRQQLPAMIAALERWTAEKKRSILLMELKGVTRDSKEAMNGDHSKGIRALYEFFLNTLRAFYFLPKGRNYRRLLCNCDHDGQQLLSTVNQTERSKSRSDSRYVTCHSRTDPEVLKRKYLRKFVLERKTEAQPHLHSCSNVRCTRKESTPGNFKVCRRCLKEANLVRHYYCSRACQLEEWTWSHGTFHTLIKPPAVIGSDSLEVEWYQMMIKENGRYEEITCNLAPGAHF